MTRPSRRGPAVWITALCVLSAVVIAASFLAGTLVESPWEEAVANAERVPAVTAQVTQRSVARDVVAVQGTYSAGTVDEVRVAGEDVAGVVTAQKRQPGESVVSGDVLGEVSGRPVVGLSLTFRLYRDIAPGDTGPDVEQLQQALAALGLFEGQPDGEYGRRTVTAVDALYRRVGYRPPPTAPDLAQAVDAAEKERETAVRARDAAVAERDRAAAAAAAAAARDAASGAPEAGASAVPAADPTVEAELALRDADEALADARFAALTPVLMAEVVRLPAGAVGVVSALPVGADVVADGEPVVRLRGGAPSVTVRVGMSLVDSLPVGSAVRVSAAADTTSVVDATVAVVGEFEQPDEVATLPGYDVTVAFGATAPPFEDGATVLVESVTAAAAVDGLAVPVVALRDGADGTYVVAGGVDVAVEVLAIGDGWAVVASDELTEGDVVALTGGASTGGGRPTDAPTDGPTATGAPGSGA